MITNHYRLVSRRMAIETLAVNTMPDHGLDRLRKSYATLSNFALMCLLETVIEDSCWAISDPCPLESSDV